MTRDVPRRPTTSRAPTSRPRKLAGQDSAPAVEEVAQQPSRDPGSLPRFGSPGVEPGAERPPQPPSDREPAEKRGLTDLFDSRRATAILVGLVVVLTAVAGSLFAWERLRDDDSAKPSEQPVVIGADDATAAVDAAAKAAQTILTRDHQNYDQQIDDATALMTDAFAEEFRRTAEEVRDGFVAAKTDQQVRVVAQGVTHATRTEVQALLFMNYYVSKDGSDTTYTPYRVLVTVMHTDRGWLVSGIDTK